MAQQQQTTVPSELLQAMSSMMANALQASIANMSNDAEGTNGGTPAVRRLPPFSMTEFRSAKDTSAEDYFKRFSWSLELSKISEDQFANYARVHMGAELNNALKFLVSPRLPEDVSFEELCTVLIAHFDQAKNKYAESIKFRLLSQRDEETTASFALRLRQGAAHCEYGDFLNRMLREQLLHGLKLQEMCDEIVAKKPATFMEAFEIANTLEATHLTTNVVKTSDQPAMETTHKLGYGTPRTKFDTNSRHPFQSRGSNNRDDGALPKQRAKDSPSAGACNGCGGQHLKSRYRFCDVICNTCGKKGHLARVCRSKETLPDARLVAY
ncbi:uncharacterized protein [Cardiocondyla obscurior]|uniref:uncharacterized protein n=1 Tax=Cardiocondyla obscurior TaxID=286306 RepID=UPI0039657FBC